jgi:hypothetical protein
MRRVLAVVLAGSGAVTLTPVASAKVLRVGTYHRISGQFSSIQAAVNAAKRGDWVLVAPGDYKTSSSRAPKAASDTPAGVLITTARLHLRGMNRNTVIVDGTKPGSPACSTAQGDQNFGPTGPSGPLGLNGIMVWKANGVWVQNLTACNFLGGTGAAGNEIWWNGGDNSAQIGGWGFYGSYLNATSTYFADESSAATYGIFSSNWSGGTWDRTYASNFSDSGYYIGACQQVCNQTVNHAWAEYSALGYSGSNSGGQLVVKNSEFDHNEDGFDTNSQNGDNPPPQDGACPGGGTSPITHTHSCWVFMNNYVHDNNNANVPSSGSAAAGPVGTGMSVSGGRDDTIVNNRFVNNGAWGVIFVPYPDSGSPCTGGTQSGAACLYDEWGDALQHNTFSGNGSFGNPTNGDFALTNAEPGPTNCLSGNVDTGGTFTTTPSNAEQMYPSCNGQTVPPSDSNPQSAQFTEEVACDSQIYLALSLQPPCLPTDSYPRRTQVVMPALPPASKLPTMANPCARVPANPWCPAHKKRRHKHNRRHHAVRASAGRLT